jgi:hypothetical protein
VAGRLPSRGALRRFCNGLSKIQINFKLHAPNFGARPGQFMNLWRAALWEGAPLAGHELACNQARFGKKKACNFL